MELKILRKSLKQTLETGLRQTRQYMDRCGTREGQPILFDRTENKSREEKIFQRKEEYKGHVIGVWGMWVELSER